MLSSRLVALPIDSHVYPSKTPGRMRTRAENALPMSVHPKGKEIMMQTPFHPAKQAHQKAPTTTQALGKQALSRPTRILGDKTPFPNRKIEKLETPASQLSKLPVLSFPEPQSQLQFEKTPDSLRRPSSARTQDRVLRNANKLFVTPTNNGNHWDVSELSISPPEAETQESKPPEDDFDEIEYMPPNTLHLAFEPAVDIELPNYKEVGKALFELAYTCPIDETPVTEIEINEKDIELPGWDLLPVSELEDDDPFQRGRELKSTTVRTRVKTTLLSKETVAPVKKTLVRPSPQALPLKSISSLRSEPSASTLKTKRDSSLRPTPSAPRKVPTNNVVPTLSRISFVKPIPPTNDKARATVALRQVKPASKSTQSAPSRLATPAATLSRPTSTSMIVRRPMISTSHCKILPSVRKAVSSGGVKDEGTSINVIPFAVEAGADLCEDFRFNV